MLGVRQIQILKLLAKGLSVKQIAHELKLSYKTARDYTTKLHEEFSVHSNLQAVMFALKKNIIKLEEI